MRDRQSTPDTKSHHSQPTKEREPQRTTAQEEALVTQQNPLTQTISRMGSAPSAKVHANLLSRATADHPARGRQLMLQMQRQYGNRYVQRVVELSRQGAGEAEATPEVEAAIEQARGGGRSLDAGIQRQMESAFGTNFSGVRVHTDSTADALNQSLSARAFTTGQDIFFRQGEYNPGSSSGKELLAHELTHVVQQTGGTQIGRMQTKLAIGEPDDQYEQEADRVAGSIMAMFFLSDQSAHSPQAQPKYSEDLTSATSVPSIQRELLGEEEQAAKLEQTSQPELATLPEEDDYQSIQTKFLQTQCVGSGDSQIQRKCSTCEQEETIFHTLSNPTFTASRMLQRQNAIEIPPITITSYANSEARCLSEVESSKASCLRRGMVLCSLLWGRLGGRFPSAGGQLGAGGTGGVCYAAYDWACNSDAQAGVNYCRSKRECLESDAPASTCPTSPYVIGDPWPH
jgi:hypothetical protein